MESERTNLVIIYTFCDELLKNCFVDLFVSAHGYPQSVCPCTDAKLFAQIRLSSVEHPRLNAFVPKTTFIHFQNGYYWNWSALDNGGNGVITHIFKSVLRAMCMCLCAADRRRQWVWKTITAKILSNIREYGVHTHSLNRIWKKIRWQFHRTTSLSKKKCRSRFREHCPHNCRDIQRRRANSATETSTQHHFGFASFFLYIFVHWKRCLYNRRVGTCRWNIFFFLRISDRNNGNRVDDQKWGQLWMGNNDSVVMCTNALNGKLPKIFTNCTPKP